MRPGREMDTRIAKEIFGHEVWATNKTLHEKTPEGKRPLRLYTKEIEWAFAVAEKMKITLLSVEGNRWFAFSAENDGWESPQAFVEFLAKGDYKGCGASVGENAAFVICEAALRAIDKRAQEREAALEATMVAEPTLTEAALPN
ncbi:MAG: hypothetical protein EOP11_03385 [Proteobacteria bacterium]|nr:MAG: hypothetical protein EOP11_03385 [Pseudomonadota bacterium]